MATGDDHHAALEIVEKNGSSDDWQEENAVGHVANVDGHRGCWGIAAFHQVHDTIMEICDDQVRINRVRRSIRK